MQQGDIIEVSLHGMSNDGRAVGRLKNGITVFVQNALVGQVIEAEILNVKKKLLEATCVKVLEKSPHEIQAFCKHSSVCGGCPWMGLDYDKQLEEKSLQLQNVLIRIGHLKSFADKWKHKLLPIISAKNLENYPDDKTLIYYRNKMEFAFQSAYLDGSKRQGTKIGFKKRYTHDIVEVSDCKLQNPLSMEIVKAVRAYCNDKDLPYLRYLIIRTPNTGKITVELITYPLAKVKHSSDTEETCIQDLANIVLDVEGVSAFTHSVRSTQTDVAYGERIIRTWGNTELSEQIELFGNIEKFKLENRAFFQVNTNMTQKLYQVIYEFASLVLGKSNNHIWDIYCGVGSIGISLAKLCLQNEHAIENKDFKKSVEKSGEIKIRKSKNQEPFLFGMESTSSAINFANKNASAYDFCKFKVDDAKNLSKYFKDFPLPNLIIFDPPRAGVDKKALNAVLKNEVPYCIMVSCDPGSLARDLEILTEKYQINAVQAVDMFPHTPHLEVVVLLSLK